MRVAMRQILKRKSDKKMSSLEKSDQKSGRSSSQSDDSDDIVSPPTPRLTLEGSTLYETNRYHTDPPTSVRDQNFGNNGSPRSREGGDQRKVTEKTQFIHSKSGPPRVIAGAKTNVHPLSYRRCEDEPIHTPGTIQPFGALLALKYNELGQLEVWVASENSRKILGYGPEQLFELPCFLDILTPNTRQEMIARVHHVLTDSDGTAEETRLDVFPMAFVFPFEPEIRLWCAIHLAPGPKSLVICEFEEYSDSFYLKDDLPSKAGSHMGVDVSPEELAKSTTSNSKPLPILDIARRTDNRQFSTLDIFYAMKQAEKQIAACKSLESMYEVVVGIISELTGIHRVMFYRFDAQMNGCIEAELHDIQANPDVFRGLHFPASDIPKQAQDLYKINRIRLLHDRDADNARLVCRNEKVFEQALDLTHSYLRAISPVHCKYLRNMSVRSTMSISIVVDSKLWGLVACHNYGDAGFRVSLPIRELCRNIGECAAANIQRLQMHQRIEDRKYPIANPTALDPKGFVATSSADLLKLVDADFAFLSVSGKMKTIGMIDGYQEALAIMSYLQSCRFNTIRSSHNIKADFPGFSYPPGLTTIGGLLLIPLNVTEGNQLLVFFRKTQPRHVTWAGNPFDKKFKAGSEYLEPRSSFKRWAETIAGMSKEWTEAQMDTASVMATLYGRLIDIAGEKAAVSQTAQMSLIRASSNEVRTPLDAIVDYLSLALDNSIDHKTREILEKAQDASNSLVGVTNDLLRLTEVDDETTHLAEESFNLKLTATRVLVVLQKEARRNKLDLNMSVHDKLPTLVKGNGDRFRQLIVCFTNKALKRSNTATVNVFLIRTNKESSTVLFQVQDSGPGMSETELDRTAREFENPKYDKHSPIDTTPSLDETDGGLGTDITAICQYVRSLNGQIQVTSEVGKGTNFSIELDFEHPTNKPQKTIRNLVIPSFRSPQGPPPSGPPPISPRSMNHDQHARMKANDTIQIPLTSRSSSLSPVQKTHPPRSRPSDQSLRKNSTNGEPSSHQYSMNNGAQSSSSLNILVAEADPLNQRAADERLSQWGYTVDIVCDGQECHDRFAANPSKFDVILMDLKMPGIDGTFATRMIRFLEKESEHLDKRDSHNAKPRVAIIAVSSTLYEAKKFDYLQSGFDGWIHKPIDFRRLDLIIKGVRNPKIRRECVYTPGQWERGGWFLG